MGMSHLINEIKAYYNTELNIDISADLESIKVREMINQNPCIQYLLDISEYILGVAVTSEQRIYYIDNIENIENLKDRETLMNILDDRITSKKPINDNGSHHESKNDHYDHSNKDNNYSDNEDEINAYISRINNLEKENNELLEEIHAIREKKYELMQEVQKLEDSNKDAEMRYDAALLSLENMRSRLNNMTDSTSDSVTYLIQISELKGRNLDFEHTIKKLRDEKEAITADSNSKIRKLNQDLDKYREKAIVYDNLVSKLEKEKITFPEIYGLRQRIIKQDNIIRDQEEKIKILKSMEDTDRGKLFKKIEELNLTISQEKNKFEEVMREKKELFDRCIETEKELDLVKKDLKEIQLKTSWVGSPIDGVTDEMAGTNLTNLEEENHLRSNILELEIKLKMSIKTRDDLQTENKELLDKLHLSEESLSKKEAEVQSLSIKINSYKKGYEDNIENLKKITTLTEKNYEMSSAYEKMKIDNLEFTNELNSKHKVRLFLKL